MIVARFAHSSRGDLDSRVLERQMSDSKPQRPKPERNPSSNRLATLASRIHPRFSFQHDPHGRRSRQLFTATPSGQQEDIRAIAAPAEPVASSSSAPAEQPQLPPQPVTSDRHERPSINWRDPDWDPPPSEQGSKTNVATPTLPPPQFQTFPPTSWASPEEGRRALARQKAQEQERSQQEEAIDEPPSAQSSPILDRELTPPSPLAQTPAEFYTGRVNRSSSTAVAQDRAGLRRASSHPVASYFDQNHRGNFNETAAPTTSSEHETPSPTFPSAPVPPRRHSTGHDRVQEETFTDDEEFQLFALATTGLGPDEIFRDNNTPPSIPQTITPTSVLSPPPYGASNTRPRPGPLNLAAPSTLANLNPIHLVSPLELTPTTAHPVRHMPQIPPHSSSSPYQGSRVHPRPTNPTWLNDLDAAGETTHYIPAEAQRTEQPVNPEYDEPPDYAVSQAHAQYASRVEAARRAQELRRRWEMSNP